jgi:transcriptional regulatory protein AMDR
MHCNLSLAASTLMPLKDRRTYRRVWWTLFQTEILTVFEHGRPSMIHLDEIEQASLDLDDFKEGNGLMNIKLQYDYCSRNIDLCFVILEVLRLNRPGVRLGDDSFNLASLNSRLTSWILGNPPSDEFWALHLHMHYHTVLIHLHRNFIDQPSPTQGVVDSAEICNAAASAIVSILETLVAKNIIGQCYFTSIIALTAAAIHFARDIKLAISKGSALLALNTQNRLERLFPPAKELALYWPNAEAVLKVF